MTMNDIIRILIVEDNLPDFELAKREISRSLKNCEFKRVQTRREYLKALDAFQPDIILSDYTLPGFNGMKALQLAHEHAPLTPLIIWTGTTREDIAVDCMKAGANNYVLKENLKRLGPAIMHALEERQLLIERRQAEEKTHSVLENSPIGIFQSTPQGQLISVNPAMARIHGYSSPQEMMGAITDIAQQMYPEPEEREEFTKLFETHDVVENYEGSSLRKDGSVFWTSTSARVVRDNAGKILYYEGFLQDITERKSAEEALKLNEKRFRSLLVHGLDSISLLAADGTLIWESPAVMRILDYPHNYFIGRNIFEIMHPDDLAWTRDLYIQLIQEPGRREHQSFRLRHSDGTWRWVEAVVTNMLDEPGVNAIVVNYRDITERKEAEEKLRESEERYRLLFESNPLPMWIYDLETLAFLKVNDAAIQHYGYTADEFMAMTIKDIRPPEDVPALVKLLGNAPQGISRADTWRHCKKDGTVIFVDIVSHTVEFGGRKAELVLANDITERRQAERELQQRNDDLGVINAINEAVIRGDSLDLIIDLLAREIKRLFAGESSTIYMFDADGKTLTMPRYFLRSEIVGKIEKLIGRSIPSIHIPVREGGYFHRVLSSGRGTITSNPSEIQEWMSEFVETTFLPAMGKNAIRSLIPQIFKLLNIKSAIVVPLISDGKPIGILDTSSSGLFTEEDLERVGNIARQLTAAIQRQQVQEKLLESENRLILALSAAQMSVWEWNLQTNDVLWSPEFYAITGITENTFDGTFEGYTDLIHPQDVERVRSAAEKAVAADTMFAEEFRIIRPDGEIRWLANLGHAEYGSSDNHLRMIGTVQDITQRKQVEVERQALLGIMQGLARTQDLHEFLALIHRSIGNVIFAENFFVVFHDPKTGLFEEIYSVDQYDPPAPPSRLEKSITSYVFRTGEPLLLTQSRFEELLAQGEVELIGTNSASWLGSPLKTPTGTIGVIAVQDYENSNRYSERDRNFLASIATQVALAIERKQAEEEMRRSEERYRALFENSPVSIWEEDFSQVRSYVDALKQQGVTDFRSYFAAHPESVSECAALIRVLDVNHAGLEMYKAEGKAELIDKTLHVLSTGEQSHNLDDFVAIAEGRNSNAWEGTDETLTGEPLEISLKWSVAPGYERDFSKVIVTVFDITELKRAERAEHEQRTLAEALRDTAEILNSTLDYGVVLDHILSAVGRVVPHDAATIMLIDGDTAHVVRSHGYNDRQIADRILGIKLSIANTTNLHSIIETGQTVIVHDTHNYPGWHRMPITDWLRSNVGAPISIYGKIIGFILLDSQTVGFFTPIHAERLEAFANQAAIAIHNANMLQQAQEEIAERKRAEEKLRASEERFRQMADNIEEVFWMTDARTGEELYMSPASQQVWGRTPEYLTQNSAAFMESILPEDRPVVQRGLERERAGEKVEMEYRILRPDGSIGWIWDRAFPVFDEEGQVKTLAGIAADVTERKLAEEKLRASEERYHSLFENLVDGFALHEIVTDEHGQPVDYIWLEVNPAFEKLTGLRAADILGKRVRDVLSETESERFIPLYGQVALTGDPIHFEEFFVSLGRYFDINAYSPAPRQFAVTFFDITERKIAEDALRESEARFSNAFEFAPIGIALVSLEGKWLKVNRSLCDLLGYSTEELYQKNFQEITHPDDLEADLNYVQQLIRGEIVSYQMEKRYFHKSGTIVWVLLSVSLVRTSDGNPAYAISQIQDITQRKQAEEEISRRAEETSALLAASMALTNLDLHAILNSVGNSAKALFMADGCRIFLMHPDGESLRCVLALQEDSVAFDDLRVRLGEGVTGAVAASGLAEIVNTMQDDPRAIQVPGTQEEEEAIMFAPLKERDRTLGVLSVRRAGKDRPFESEDLEFLEAFASMAASAVSNARLFEETQRRLSELEALYENGLAVGQLLEPRQIGERIIETFARHLSWHHVAIRLVRPETDELELIAFNQPDLSEKERSQAVHHFNSKINKIGQGLSGWAVQTGQPIRSGNVYDYPQYIPTYPGILSGLYMPLKIGERVIGVISVESEEAEALTAQDERLLTTLANQAAIAFENARLYQAAQQEISERKRVEKELRESQERYQLLVETSPDGVILLGMDGTVRFSNGQMAGLFHVDHPAELVGTSITSLFAPEERQYIEQNMGNLIFSDTTQEGHWLIRKDGSRFFGELRSSALKNEAGEQYAVMAQLRDMTERKQAQEALQEERQRFLDLFENSPNPTWLEDFTAVVAWMNELRTHGVQDLRKYMESNPGEYREAVGLIRILNVNQAAVIVNGARNKKELIGRVHELMLDEVPSDVMTHELDMIWQGHTSFGFEMTSRRLNGSLITGIQRIYIPINNDRPDYARVIVTSTDITDRVEMESKLRASELHYRELADSITDVLFELDHDLRYTHWNKASEILMGIPAYDAIGRSMYEVFGESEEQLRIGRIYQDVLEENRPRTFETVILLQGQKLVFEINANPSTRGVSVVARNITDRKLTETLLKKRFELMDYALHHSLSEVMQKTIDIASELTGSHVGFMNFIEDDKSMINVQAFSTETIRSYHHLQGGGMHQPVQKAGVWADAIRQQQAVIHNDYEALENKNGLPDGHFKVIREMVIPIIRNDVVVAVMGVGNKELDYTRQDVETAERFADYAWDITERKQMENALAEERNQLAKRVEERTADLSRANSNLARALRVKDEFLANMSHELRTPLNAILGLSESLGEQVAGPLNEKQQKYLATINESGHHLLSLINDILDLAKIEAGQITLDINKVDVNSVCQASLRMIKQLAQKKNQEVLFEMDNELGLMWADERRLKQMIVNLLSNAVKFTPESGQIGLEVRGDRAANKVIITVSDTGIGIKEQDLERLFKPFVQLDSGLAREATGTGLGLALVAQMARLHGGSVHALSQPGEGSRFIIQLPWEPAMASDIVARLRNTGKFRAINPDVERLTILLIEDTREVVMMLVDYLEMAGYNILTAQDGIEGLEQAKLTKPDLILMDIQMPRMDGFETTQKLRSDPEFKDIPIIALTALAMPNDRQRCLDAGMDEYMSKPVNLKALTKTIHKLLFQNQKAGLS